MMEKLLIFSSHPVDEVSKLICRQILSEALLYYTELFTY